MKTTFKSADLKMSLLSNVYRCWLAMPPVAGFLEMFKRAIQLRKKRKSNLHPPPCTNLSVCSSPPLPPPPSSTPSKFIRYIYVEDWFTKMDSGSTLVCHHFMLGFYKFGNSCRKSHIQEICLENTSENKDCLKTQPINWDVNSGIIEPKKKF